MCHINNKYLFHFVVSFNNNKLYVFCLKSKIRCESNVL